MLIYKTRTNVTPQGKPKVYFCAAPEDYIKYFDQITDEILNKENCSIWYLSDATSPRTDELLSDLKQMQLFVMPITSNLLCSDNAALNVDFKFATENHIPVLPLMQETGLDRLFNQKCGNLQFLDKTNTDQTSISYDDKLKKYLSAVLIGDSTAEKIRAAFDAYVFLSYRKKDRKYAQELMRLIHKNEFCRDIAIWYDEFLTPGENFNKSIKDAIEKSGLFVLAVTPNIVNESNYIMTTEYPLACETGKRILPAELLPTDRKRLFQNYKDIPEPTDAYNDEEFKEALLSAIEKIAIKENDNSPEHNFFIGLAYLGGIDVEIDFERACRLITFAAENGLPEAQAKLSSMYQRGHGVERDLEKATQWQKSLAELLTAEYEEDPNEDTAFDVFDAYIDLGDLYGEGKYITEAKDAFSIAVDMAEIICALTGSVEAKELYLAALNRTALALQQLGEFEKFNQLMEEIVSASEDIYDDDTLEKSVYLSNMGLACFFQQDYKTAKDCFLRAIGIVEAVDSDGDDEGLLLIKSKIYNNLGLLHAKIGEYETAEEQYFTALKLMGELNEKSEQKYNEEYGIYASNLADTYLACGENQEALAIAIEVGEELTSEYNKFHSNRLIGAIAYMEIIKGRAYTAQLSVKKADEHYVNALDWYNAQNGRFAEMYRAEIAMAYRYLGSNYLFRRKYKTAEKYTKMAYDVFVEMSKKEKAYRELRALAAYDLGYISVNRLGGYKRSLPYLLDSYEIFMDFMEEGLTIYKGLCEKSGSLLAGVYLFSFHPVKAVKFVVEMSDKIDAIMAKYEENEKIDKEIQELQELLRQEAEAESKQIKKQ